MSNMDLDDLDGAIKAPTRKTSRFLPKASKLKPETKAEPQELHDDIDSLVSNQKKEDTKPMISRLVQDDDDDDDATAIANAVSKMEVEANAAAEEPKEDSMMNIDDAEDYVVREIDVYVTPPADDNTQIYVMQYVMRPDWRPYELDEQCEVRVKPKNAEVEVDVPINVQSENYDADWVENTRMAKSYDTDWAKKVKVAKQTLSTSWNPPRKSGYAIGILIGNKLHLNPIHAVVQLRPSMKHLDGGPKNKVDVTSDDGLVKSEEFNKKEPIGPSKKHGKVTGNLNEQNTADKECWVPLNYHGSKSDFSAKYLQKLVAEESCPIQFSVNPYGYLSSLCPGASNNNISSRDLSKRSLLSLPLEERLKKWLCEGNDQVHRFDTLKHFAPNVPIEDILQVVQEYAILVQGLWVPKSSVALPQDQLNQALARDFVLLLFSKSLTVSYSLLDLPHLPPAQNVILKSFMKMFADERPALKIWKFKQPKDESFVERHPDIVMKQQELWNSMEKKITDAVYGHGKKSRHGVKSATKYSIANRPETSINSDKGAARTANENYTEGTTMSDETREALPKALKEIFKNHNVCSFQTICEGLRELALSKATVPKAVPSMFVVAAYGVDSPPEELKAVINEVAINVHGVYVSKSSSQHPEFNPLRAVVIDLLCGKPDAKLKKAEIMEAAKITLNREIPMTEYNKVVPEICEYKGSAWTLKSGDGKSK